MSSSASVGKLGGRVWRLQKEMTTAVQPLMGGSSGKLEGRVWRLQNSQEGSTRSFSSESSGKSSFGSSRSENPFGSWSARS